ncbi:glycine-rich protein [Halosimplex pelagicum]|uniref:receptor protein-tyrosine kinase n=1 Tax=Halosimplex pelagicum TaxID=869886 RepID=A0A7D5TCW9_9EURY|nr:glycine-rich protein [Halosimplex pelagicum]QLH82455.1 fibronectin type III domain-containing protein [Halosimplex pelagicum]QLH82511.1 fibronectin type III domain-containing protein [Halosimplex pelagicum]
MPTETFDTVGSHTWTVPDNVAQVTIRVWGASTASAEGGRAEATFDVTGISTLYPYVGGEGGTDNGPGGFNGGGAGGSGTQSTGNDGGGATDVRRGGETLSDRLIVAGGAGGWGSYTTRDPGHGGGANQNGQEGEEGAGTIGGEGGTLSSGGAGGTASAVDGEDGSLGQGGAGASTDTNGSAGGGGGGGYYGGGGGGVGAASDDESGGPGGGGSGWVASSGTNVSGSTGVRAGDGRVEIEYVLGPVPGVDATTSAADAITVTWDDPFSTEDSFELYRSTSPGVDTSGSPFATVGAGVTSFVDAGLPDGERYYYRVCATQGGEQGNDSAEVAATTALPAPGDLAVSNVTADSVDLSWTNTHDNGTVTVQYRPTDTSTWQDAATGLSRSTESYTLSGLRNGEAHDARVLAVTEHTQTADAVFDVQPGETWTFTKPLDPETMPFEKPLVNGGTVRPDDAP